MDPLFYVINRMEHAAQSKKPAEAGYGQARKELLEGIVSLRTDNLELRKLLWLHHGHQGIYGDDGEMQCSRCRIDFKRDPIKVIEQAFTR